MMDTVWDIVRLINFIFAIWVIGWGILVSLFYKQYSERLRENQFSHVTFIAMIATVAGTIENYAQDNPGGIRVILTTVLAASALFAMHGEMEKLRKGR